MSVHDTEKLKGLKRQLSKAEGEYEALKIQVANAQRECSEKLKKIKEIAAIIESMGKITEIHVSDHAIVRYLERVCDVNIEELKSEILRPDIIPLIEKLGTTGAYPTAINKCGTIKQFQVVMRDNNVTTIKT